MNVIVLGAGGHAKVVIDVIERVPALRLIGVIDQHASGGAVLGHPVLGGDAELSRLVGSGLVQGAVIAVGDNWVRSRLAWRVRESLPSVEFPAVVHPGSWVARTARIGSGTVVMAGAVVNSDAIIGDFCILNTHSSIDHETMVGDFASVGPCAGVGGSARIGPYSAVGIGATLIHRVGIGEHTVIGAGATVVRDVPARVVAYGTPARVVRHRTEGEKYL